MKTAVTECSMNKELFVSSTPHETKVGLVEDDLLAEIYLERENEYTLAGSIYKGRVTRVLPGMQSAFVDIGLERDAFLYVSDFMDLEEHDDDLTDVVPTNRGVQDMRPQPVRGESQPVAEPVDAAPVESNLPAEAEESSELVNHGEGQPAAAAEHAESSIGGDSGRDRGAWRGGRRRRRGGRRQRGFERGSERGGERSFSRPADAAPSRPSGPPAGYQPILLPGESISKYQRRSQAPVQEAHPAEAATEVLSEDSAESVAPVATAFPEDEPIFAGATRTQPLHQEPEEVRTPAEDPVDTAATSMSWNREFRRPEEQSAVAPARAEEVNPAVEAAPSTAREDVNEQDEVEEHHEHLDQPVLRIDSEPPSRTSRDETPIFAAPGTMEEETIDEDEVDTVHYEASSDDSFDEFEEETRAADQREHLNGDAREAVSEIHMASIAESDQHAAAEASHADSEEDNEEMELEEAQAQAEALLDAEARGNGTVDARAEVRAPAATAGYTQRSSRRFDRQYERRGGDRGRRGGGRRFRRREAQPVPLISDLLKEGQEILVQIAKE